VPRAAWLALLCVAALSCACSEDLPVEPIDLSRREAVDLLREDQAVTYAYLPQYAHRVSYRRHHLLIEYLRQQTGIAIRQLFPDTFDEHMRQVQQGKVDISFTNPFVYVKMARRSGNRAFAQVIEELGQKDFRGQIICRADNAEIRTVADLRGKRVIAVDPSSAGGYLYPMGFLSSQGITERDLAEIAFAPGPGGKQEKVVLAVHAGQYDAGMIREGTLAVAAETVNVAEIRVVASSPWLPGWVFSARRDVDPEVVAKITTALLALSYDQPEQRRILDMAEAKGFAASDDASFDRVRELMASLNLEPQHY
jgi:phosphonate transport system substrate-binding protein